jgi:hypothetical protein
MPLISDEDFLQLQSLLGRGYDGLAQAYTSVESGLAVVVASTDIDVAVDMVGPFSQNLTTTDVRGTSGLLRVATESLERHVQNKTGQTFNDYLFTRGLQVTPSFALLSGYLGVPISPLNVS